MARNKKLFRMTISILCLLLIPAAVHAVPVGVFSWDEDSSFGAVFSVGNFSDDSSISLGPPGASFFDVFVDLGCTADCRQDDLLDDGGSYTINLGNLGIIDPGTSAQSFEDFTGASIDSASLRLVFGSPALPGSMTLPVLILANTSDQIDYASPEGQPVPEPSTLILLCSGLAGAAFLRKRMMAH
jgi:hypothetical protein